MWMIPYRLPLKFILLWLINLAVFLTLSFTTDLGDILFRLPVKDLTWIYLLTAFSCAYFFHDRMQSGKRRCDLLHLQNHDRAANR